MPSLNSLGFDFNSQAIMPWVNLGIEEESIEDEIYKIEYALNGEFGQYGFIVDSMVTYPSDDLELPNHYVKVKLPTA